MNIEGIEGVVDDVTTENNDEGKADPTELISGLQDQMQKLQEKMEATAREKQELVDNHAKAIGFIEGSGTGRYDAETGQIIRVEKEQSGPDPMEELQATIKATEKDIMQQYKSGDITQVEYYEMLQENVAPLKDQYKDMQFDRKFNTLKEELKPKETEVTIDQSKSQIYDNLAIEYPDIANTDSDLFKKMNDIYLKNPKMYGNANYNDGKGDPDQYKDLVYRATVELKADGIDIKKQQSNIRHQFATPGSTGYQEPAAPKHELSKAEIGMMVSQGFTNKSLLNDVNSAVSTWEQSGSMEMND